MASRPVIRALNAGRKLSNLCRVRRAPGRGVRRIFRPHWDLFEDRVLLSTFLVTTAADSSEGSLRQAILDADADTSTSSTDTIEFAIAGAGVQDIQPTTNLPAITRPVTIDGTSQPGYAGAPLIDLDGTHTGAGTDGLVLAAGSDGSTIRGLVINNFNAAEISIATTDNTVQSCYLGTNATGTSADGQPIADGIVVTAANNTIGGTTAGAGNVFNGNGGTRVEIIGSGATGNLVEGNSIEGTTTSDSVQEFSTQQPAINPDQIVSGPDGNVWFVELASGAPTGTIAEITPAGQVYPFPTPHPVGGLAFAPDGNIWFSGRYDIGEMNQEGEVLRDYDIQSAHYLDPPDTGINITLGPDGNIWYTEPYVQSDIVGKLNTVDGQICEYPIPFGDEGACDIITGPDGNLWFDSTGGNAMGRVTPTGIVTIYNNPAYARVFRGLTSGPNGNLWLTTNEDNTIVEINTAGQLVATFSASGSPYGMTMGPDGNLWYDESSANNIGRITPQGVVTEFPIHTPNAVADPPTVGPDGNIWFSEFAANQIGEVVLSTGVAINGASGNTIGGTTAAVRNVIGGGMSEGVLISGSVATGNTVEGNVIGDALSGMPTLANGPGVVIDDGASGNTIGGNGDGAGNVISGNFNAGIELSDTATSGNTVAGNAIGTDITGSTPLGNYGPGIAIQGAIDTQIGGPGSLSNIIAFNRGPGVLISFGIGNTIRENSLFGNEGGIDSSNNSQVNAPVLSAVVVGNSSTTVSGTIMGAAGKTFTLDFYANTGKDPGGYYEGQFWLGSYCVTTDQSGNATFKNVGVAGASPGDWITATATDSAGTTSEFSAAFQTPLAVPGPNQTLIEGTTITLNGSRSTHAVDDPLTYSWNFGDGQTASGPIVTHVYDAGTYSATLTVSDAFGNTSSAAATVTAIYVPPQVNAPVENVPEAASITVPDPFSNPYAGGQYRYLWHLIGSTNGDTVPDSSAPDLTFAPYDAGSYTFQATDTDNGNFSTLAYVTVNVSDTAPTAFIPVLVGFNPGVSEAISLADAYDVSPGETAAGFHYAFATDGASLSGATYANSSASPTAMFAFATLGDHTITARIIDKNGGYTEYTTVADVVLATVYAVDQTTDLGIGSGTTGDISFVVEQANQNQNPVGSLIYFAIPTSDPGYDAATGSWTITLTHTVELSQKAGPVVIYGLGAARLTLSGNDQSGVFLVDNDVNASLSGMTITQGAAVNGGGIANMGGALTIEACTIEDNTARKTESATDSGGATGSSSSSSSSSSSAQYPSTGNGGGIYDSGRLVVDDSNINNNSASRGGGIYVSSGSLTVNGGTVDGDFAGFSGGGIANESTGAVTINGSYLQNCYAGNAGGGIANDSTGTVTVNDSHVEYCIASSAGGQIANASGGNVILNDSTIFGNFADCPVGDGIANESDGAVMVNDCIFQSCEAFDAGGAIVNESTGTVTIDDSEINLCQVVNGDGGAIANESTGTVSVIDSTFRGNVAQGNGGAIANKSTGTVTVTGTIVEFNSVYNFYGDYSKPTHGGGGIANESTGTVTVISSTIDGNYTISGYGGGGIANSSGGVLALVDCTVEGNSGSGGAGGVYDSGTLTVDNCTIANNFGVVGAGIYVNSGSVTLFNSTIADNGFNDLFDGTNGSLTLYNTIVGDLAGAPVSAASAYNLVSTDENGSIANGTNGNQAGTTAKPIDLLLGPLEDNGGPTQTMALLPNSPAIDNGASTIPGVTIPSTDQRGALRGQAGLNAGSNVDIGAYEASSSYLVTSTADTGDVGTLSAANGWASVSLNANPANLSAAGPAANTIVFNLPTLAATPAQTQTNLQQVVSAIQTVPSGTAPSPIVLQPTTANEVATVITAINNLAPATGTNSATAIISLDLGTQDITSTMLAIPAGVQVVLTSSTSSGATVSGATVSGGTVVIDASVAPIDWTVNGGNVTVEGSAHAPATLSLTAGPSRSTTERSSRVIRRRSSSTGER